MISTPSYRKAFFSALTFHLFLVILLLTDSTTQRPVLTMEAKNTPGSELPMASTHQPEVVKAVSVNNKEVMEAVNRLKQERSHQQQAELSRQKNLEQQAQAAKQQRIKEQQQIAKLKEEANTIAIKRKKMAEEEKKHLKELTEQKAIEAKRIVELKQQKEKLLKEQATEAKKLAQLTKKKELEKALSKKMKADDAKAQKELAQVALSEKIKADKANQQQAQAAAAAQAQENAQQQARLAGEVDKYKALIVNAIGRNWILPEKVDSSMSSQFRIRLAPDGNVLEVSLTRSSGDALLDRSAQTAIYKASPLPVPTDAETFNLFRDISLTVRPEQVRG